MANITPEARSRHLASMTRLVHSFATVLFLLLSQSTKHFLSSTGSNHSPSPFLFKVAPPSLPLSHPCCHLLLLSLRHQLDMCSCHAHQRRAATTSSTRCSRCIASGASAALEARYASVRIRCTSTMLCTYTWSRSLWSALMFWRQRAVWRSSWGLRPQGARRGVPVAPGDCQGAHGEVRQPRQGRGGQ
jgi:hypothetical protein